MSSTSHQARPLSMASTEALSRVRDVLRRAGYSSGGLAALVGAPRGQDVLDTIDPVHFLLRRNDDAPLGVLARVFLTDAEVEVETFRRAVAPSPVEDWLDLGLV